MCTVLEASTSGYYTWLGRDNGPKIKRKNAIIENIQKIHAGSRKTYGSPRIFQVLKGMGEQISKSTVERFMRENGIYSKMKKKFKVTTDSRHSLPISDNILNRNFAVGEANKAWCTDITYVWTIEGWLYLAGVIDVGTRKIVGWAMGEQMSKRLVLSALDMAVKRQKPSPGLIIHSDRGSQYASKIYQRRLRRYGMKSSMSRKGDCWDNSVMESFFHTLKVEHVYDQFFKSRAEATNSIFEWIEVFYNRQRVHSSLGFVTPECYEQQSFAKSA